MMLLSAMIKKLYKQILKNIRGIKLKIKILGQEEDPVFQTVLRHFLQAVHELQIDATIDEVTKLEELSKFPLTVYPAVYVNGELKCVGHRVTLTDAKRYIQEALQTKEED